MILIAGPYTSGTGGDPETRCCSCPASPGAPART